MDTTKTSAFDLHGNQKITASQIASYDYCYIASTLLDFMNTLHNTKKNIQPRESCQAKTAQMMVKICQDSIKYQENLRNLTKGSTSRAHRASKAQATVSDS
jgi:hypothetical protein